MESDATGNSDCSLGFASAAIFSTAALPSEERIGIGRCARAFDTNFATRSSDSLIPSSLALARTAVFFCPPPLGAGGPAATSCGAKASSSSGTSSSTPLSFRASRGTSSALSRDIHFLSCSRPAWEICVNLNPPTVLVRSVHATSPMASIFSWRLKENQK